MKKRKLSIPTSWPRRRLPSDSVKSTRVHVPTLARPNPQTKLRAEYIQMFVEAAVTRLARAMRRHDRSSMFFWPREDESASAGRTNPPARQPKKKDEAGKPLMTELAHSNDQSDTMDVSVGISQAHEFLGSWHKSASDLQEEEEEELVQCHVGSASAKTVMKVCWASKTRVMDTRQTCRNWAHPKSPIERSIMSSKEEAGAVVGVSDWVDSVWPERRGVVVLGDDI